MPISIIKLQLKNIPKTSGVYQFFSDEEEVLYVGKAKNLYKRVLSYTKPNCLSARILRMVSLVQKIEIIQTENEVEALLLEHNLIKKLAPKFNILLRDDKTFPQILITKHKFPQITKYRGSKNNGGFYFGPFASAYDVNHTIDILRKSFGLRNCSDAEFKSRKKPCLEYQIKKCLAPCVGLIKESEYQISVKNACDFLSGKSIDIQKDLLTEMQKFSLSMEYEKAANIRDKIKVLNSIQTKQNINLGEVKDFDIIVAIESASKICFYISFYRSGQNYGSKPYFFDAEEDKKITEILEDFMGQFYLLQLPPPLILVNIELKEKKLMTEFLTKILDKKVAILNPQRGEKLALVHDQKQLAIQNLEQKLAQNLSNKQLLLEIKNIFNLSKIPQKIEVYDNSHISGTNAIGAMIAAGLDGFIKSGYRKFNIRFEQKNRDDTAMLAEVLNRRFSKLKSENFPDFIIIDGGKPQLSAAQKVFDDLNIKIPFICMSKGEDRNAGEENFHQFGKEPFTLPKQAPAMYYLQRLRDEAHRFAITTHRKKRQKNFLLT